MDDKSKYIEQIRKLNRDLHKLEHAIIDLEKDLEEHIKKRKELGVKIKTLNSLLGKLK